MAALPTMMKRQTEDAIFKIYVADLIGAIAKTSGVQVNRRYFELVNPLSDAREEQKEDESAEAIIERISGKLMRMGGDKDK